MGALISIGKSAMFANYAALQTVGNNIANANTVGYSRQEAKLADAPGQFTGSGYFGKGVSVTTVSRAYDAYLSGQATQTASTAAADAARQDKLTQLEAVFPIGADGVGAAAGGLLNAFVDVASNPSDASARQVVLSGAQEFASRVRAASDQLRSLQTGLSQDVQTQVGSLNDMARQVAALNAQIASQRGPGQAPNQLLDRRDQLVKEIGQIANVTTVAADDGSVGLFVGGGQTLVLGSNVGTVAAVPDPFDPQKTMLTMQNGSGRAVIPTENLAGGSLAGLMRFQNDDLTTANNLLGQLATAVAGAVNGQQALGLDLGRPAAPGAPIFALGGPKVAAAATNAGTAALTLRVDDAARVQASDYAVAFDGAAYRLTRSIDGKAVAGSPFTAAQLAGGVRFDGVTLTLAGGAAANGDRFKLQPVATAAAEMRGVLASTDGIAAASPFVGSAGTANAGTATIASLAAVDPGYGGSLSASIAFTNASGAYAWSLSDGSSGTGAWSAGTPIELNGFALALNGVPRSGDTFAVAPTTSVASSNGNAAAMSALATSPIVAAFGTAAGAAAGRTPTDAYAAAIANIGVRVQGGRTAATISGAAATAAETARSNQSGVNLDEEAARLIQYQQSYQAAAKILQVAQQVFDSMLQMAAG